MKLINYQDARPIYEQIAEGYKTLILKGVLEGGEQMPSVRALAMELSTNPNTVQKAYTELERQGYIYTVKGKGNYVNGDRSLMINKMGELAAKIREILDEANDLGIDRKELLRSAGLSDDPGINRNELPRTAGLSDDPGANRDELLRSAGLGEDLKKGENP